MNIKIKLISLAKIIGTYAGYFLTATLVVVPLNKILPPFDVLSISGNIFGGVILLFTIGYHFLILKLFGKKDKPKHGFELERGYFTHFIASIGFAAICIVIIWFLGVVFHGFTIQLNELNGATIFLIVLLLVRMLFTGFQEEIIIRGTLAYMGKTGGKWFSAIIISLLFTFTHGASPMNILFHVNLFLFSIAAFQLTWIFGNLWSAAGFHFAWNFVMGGILGVPISGTKVTGLIISNVDSSKGYINGGDIWIRGKHILYTNINGNDIYFNTIQHQEGKQHLNNY
jgi:membrane protease YdiL (CAAX protease family)